MNNHNKHKPVTKQKSKAPPKHNLLHQHSIQESKCHYLPLKSIPNSTKSKGLNYKKNINSLKKKGINFINLTDSDSFMSDRVKYDKSIINLNNPKLTSQVKNSYEGYFLNSNRTNNSIDKHISINCIYTPKCYTNSYNRKEKDLNTLNSLLTLSNNSLLKSQASNNGVNPANYENKNLKDNLTIIRDKTKKILEKYSQLMQNTK